MARLLDSVFGHQKQIQALLKAFEAQHLASTFLFAGPSGVGKTKVALGLAQALLCEREAQACGICASCLRVEKSQHESLLKIGPEKNQIKVESAREILDFLSLRSLTTRRVVIIQDAERLNPATANALLKIFEEPPEDTFFFLTTANPKQILSTIRSRSQTLHFQGLSIEDLRKKSTAPEWTLRAAHGSFEKLKEISGKDELETRDLAVRILRDWGHQEKTYLEADFREAFRDKSGAFGLAKSLSLLLRDAVFWQLDRKDLITNNDQNRLFEELAQMPLPQLELSAQKALGLEASLLQNRDSQLVFEEFWIQTQNL